MITRQAFHYIYVNANCLTELALRNLSSDLDSLIDNLEPIENADLTLEFELETNLEDLNFDAMEGLEFYDPEMDTNITEPVSPPPLKDVASELHTNTPEQEGDFDIDTYMSNVYSLEEQLIERIDSAYNKIEHLQIKKLLDLLPSELPAIDGKLSGEEMSLWLAQYSNDDGSITDLLVTIRQLDFT
ncbi:hypothetical protein [Paraglaciecola arctica]|uniref:Uncharacterized protein n=1 Tax=Paraglaciecola arctica BSs20135 TaxID=493475 RepID=K6YQX4_9ALTE|nr:hypothetical protein [Paraglaciecola arctica]GAC20582.1 hypothetical protein GARC_3628 [Paraglaciecola arctica BSs20135]